jgi:hypothetical protein
MHFAVVFCLEHFSNEFQMIRSQLKVRSNVENIKDTDPKLTDYRALPLTYPSPQLVAIKDCSQIPFSSILPCLPLDSLNYN